MNSNADSEFTMAGLLADPLIQTMMRSDGVTDRAHAELWERTRLATIARFAAATPWQRPDAVP